MKLVRKHETSGHVRVRWSSNDASDIFELGKVGDKVFLLNQGAAETRGIFGTGVIVEPPYEKVHDRIFHDDGSLLAFQVRQSAPIVFHRLVDPSAALLVSERDALDILPTGVIETKSSSVPISDAAAEALSALVEAQPKPEGKAGTKAVSLIVPTPDEKLTPEGITWTNREGQDDFRRLVIQAYGRCAITDCIDEIALQAAHIIPYVNATSNLVQNGICLRADIHCLFDRGLVIIGEDFVVTVSSDVASAEYRRLSGRRLHLPTERALWPDLVLLRERSRWISA
jgi:hypothetical protein